MVHRLPRPLRPAPLPRPRPLPILMGFNPVTFSASSADRYDSALRMALASPDSLAFSTSFLAASSLPDLDWFCSTASSASDFSTQERQRALPSPLFHWFLLYSLNCRDFSHFAHVLGGSSVSLSVGPRLAAAAFRSSSSTFATHCLHLSLPPDLRYFSRAWTSRFEFIGQSWID